MLCTPQMLNGDVTCSELRSHVYPCMMKIFVIPEGKVWETTFRSLEYRDAHGRKSLTNATERIRPPTWKQQPLCPCASGFLFGSAPQTPCWPQCSQSCASCGRTVCWNHIYQDSLGCPPPTVYDAPKQHFNISLYTTPMICWYAGP